MNKKLNNKGFTIIEVLIVLAIAGLIMLIVFLAVPALQRNSRNTQRNSDASLIASAANECLSNRNGTIASCDTLGELSIDAARLSQLTTVVVTAGAPAAVAVGTGNTANIGYGSRCSDDGAALGVAAGRAVAVRFNIENQTGPNIARCIGS
jgi:prepilin-type N-terminal cleavage/methylation domain-containing protein